MKIVFFSFSWLKILIASFIVQLFYQFFTADQDPRTLVIWPSPLLATLHGLRKGYMDTLC